MKIAIVGGRKKAKYLLKTFSNKKKNKIVYINRDNEFCRQISREFEIPVICGDATLPAILEDAEIRDFDIFISLCPSDADSIVCCRLAKTYGVRRTISIVNDAGNIHIFKKLGVDTTVSISSIIALVIEKDAFTDSIESLLPIEDGKALMVEIEIEEGYWAKDKRLSDLQLPEDCVVCCIFRKEQAVIPRGNTLLKEGDRLIIMTLPTMRQKVVKAVTRVE